MGFAAHHRKGERVGQAGAVGQPGRAWASLSLLSSSGSASAGMAWGGAEARPTAPPVGAQLRRSRGGPMPSDQGPVGSLFRVCPVCLPSTMGSPPARRRGPTLHSYV